MNVQEPQQERAVISDGALLRAKVLASANRAEVLRLVRAATSPVTAADLAPMLRLHRTAVGRHLDRLREAGLVASVRLGSPRPGRPRLGYVALPDPVATDRHYRQLAEMLATAVRSSQSAREAGRAVGARVVPSSTDPLQALVNEAGRLGFEPTVHAGASAGDSTTIVLNGCPFADLADIDPDTVCALHLGLAEGFAERVGGMTVEGLHLADPHAGGCTLAVRID